MTQIPRTLNVTLDNNRSYPIHIGQNLLSTIGTHVANITPLPYCIVLVDENAEKHGHYDTVAKSLHTVGIAPRKYTVPSGETSKSFDTYTQLVQQILADGIERKTALIAMGGGVVGDLSGFIASTVLRGIFLIHVPTTLLSQVDSAVGGKTGINVPTGKNLVGTFYQPSMVIIDIDSLHTLPMRHMASGYAEIVKYGCIVNADFFAWLEHNGADVINRHPQALVHAIYESCRCKAHIVAKDETESSIRALLNLGHTFAHALENTSGYSDALLHGEAVSIGIIMAYKTAVYMGVSTDTDVQRVESTLRLGNVKTHIQHVDFDFDTDALIHAMYKDKKTSQGTIHFVIPQGIGTAFISDTVDMDFVRLLWHNAIHLEM